MPPLNNEQLAELNSESIEEKDDNVEEIEKKFKNWLLQPDQEYEYNLSSQLEEAGDELNDLTFGTEVNIGKDFDFFENNTKITDTIKNEEALYVNRGEDFNAEFFDENIANGKSGHTKEIIGTPTLPESPISPSIWGSFHPQSNRRDSLSLIQESNNINNMTGHYGIPQRYPPLQTSPPPGGIPEKRMLSLAEVEAAILGLNGIPPPLPMFPSTTDAALREQEKISKYNGLMTQSDKDYVNRIQISQLVTDDPYADDFYCQVYSAVRSRQSQPHMGNFSHHHGGNNGGGFMGHERGRHRSRGSESGLFKMQQQVLRIVNDARRKPKLTQLSLEGALGKIALNSVRNPRQLLQVSTKPHDTHNATVSSPGQQQQHFHQKIPYITTHGVMDHKKVLRSIENCFSAVNDECSKIIKSMWDELRVDEQPVGAGILSVRKGKKLIPRIIRYFASDQMISLLSVLVMNFESLDVCKGAIWGSQIYGALTMLEDVELFMNTVVPPLLQYVAEAPIHIISRLFAFFLEKNQIIWVSRCKVGLAFLTMFLSRAEILKQGGGKNQSLPIPDEHELLQWYFIINEFFKEINDLYNRLFNLLQGHYVSLFPPFGYGIDDMYVWQFLAAMAVGASIEQQHVLVTEVRERVIETISKANNRFASDKTVHKIANVNLFLNALGLDASQLNL
ncbi:8191_t:CDS:10 [Entrophospora sp. SA101]|nr:8191_t:CDS:10 [Entrophospora sp. SA101]CAJ0908379.1 474_t:CDS:10 [Entrophospora sp. SA101]